MERLDRGCADLAAELLDRGRSRGLRRDRRVAEPLPVLVIAELLGVPRPTGRPAPPWSQAIVHVRGRPGPAGRGRRRARGRASSPATSASWSQSVVPRPRDDLISDLVGRPTLTEDELVAAVVLLLNAGHEATVNVFGNGLAALLHRGAGTRRRSGPASRRCCATTPRFSSSSAPPPTTCRSATSSSRAGQKIAALLGAANRDPAVFDARTSWTRPRPEPAPGLRRGIHFCLGAPLARLELGPVARALFAAYPDLALAGEPVSRGTFVLRGFHRVPVGGG